MCHRRHRDLARCRLRWREPDAEPAAATAPSVETTEGPDETPSTAPEVVPTTDPEFEAGEDDFCNHLVEAISFYQANPGPASPGPADVEVYFRTSLDHLTVLESTAPDSIKGQLTEYREAMTELITSLDPDWNLAQAAQPDPKLLSLREELETRLAESCGG